MYFTAREARIALFPLELLHDQLHIREIYLDEPTLEIKVIAASEDAQRKIGRDNTASSADKFSLVLDRLMLREGKFIFKKGNQILYLSQLNASADHIGSRQETDLKCDFLGSFGNLLADKLSPVIAGNMAIRTKIRYYAPNLTFRKTAITVTATENPTAIWLSPLTAEMEGVLNTDTLSLRLTTSTFKSSVCALNLDGEYNGLDKSFRGLGSLSFFQEDPARDEDFHKYDLVLASPVNMEKYKISFPDIAISSGSSRGSGQLELRLAQNDENMKLEGNLAFGALSIPVKKEKGRTKSKPQPTHDDAKKKMLWPEVNISISAHELYYDRFSFSKINFQFLGSGGVYDLRDLIFDWANGTASGKGHINFTEKLVQLKTDGKNIEIGKALGELGISGFQGGQADYDANLAAIGFNMQNIKESLTGDFNFKSRNVKISLLEEIGGFVSRFNIKGLLIPKAIDNFNLNAHAENGKINLDASANATDRLKATLKGDVLLATDAVSAQINLDILGMALPVGIDGTLSDISWRIEPAWLKGLFKSL